MKKVTFSSKPTNNSDPVGADAWVHDKRITEPTKRLTVDIPLSLHLRIKSQCALHNRLISDVIREILENHFVEVYEKEDAIQLTTGPANSQL